MQVKVPAKQGDVLSPTHPPTSPNVGWTEWPSLVTGLVATLVGMAVVTGIILLLIYARDQAFAQMIEKVNNAISVRFTLTTVPRSDQQLPESTRVVYAQGSRMRIEESDGRILVQDFDRMQFLLLDTRRKLAQRMEMDANFARMHGNPVDRLRRVTKDDAERIGQETLDGRRTQVYRLRNVDLLGIAGLAETRVWIDAESGLPVKIATHHPTRQMPMDIRLDRFVWNGPLDPRLFSLAAPEGFEAGTVK